MMEVVWPGPSSGAGSPPELPSRVGERSKESSSKGLRRIGQDKLAELWHCRSWCCLSLFKEQI